MILQWIPHSEIWPYLKRYTVDAKRKLLVKMERHPDLTIDNYSEGNLEVSLLPQHRRITPCTIAHTLEKN